MRVALVDRRWARSTAQLLGVAALLAAWQLVASSGAVTFLVPFSTAVSRMWALLTGDSLTTDVVPSVVRTVVGFAIGSAAGIVIGALVGYFRRIDPWVRPLLEFLRATPIPAVIPVAILTLGPTNGTRVFLIALGCVWPVLLNAIDGTRSVDPRYLDAARVARFGSLQILVRVIWPASLPRIFTGLRIGLAIALIMMVVSEMMASTSGLGHFVLEAQRTYALNDMYGGILLLGVLGGVFTLAFALVERRVLAWYLGRQGLDRG